MTPSPESRFAHLRARWSLYRWLSPTPESLGREKARFHSGGDAEPCVEYPVHDAAELDADRRWLDQIALPEGPLGALLQEEREYLAHQLAMVAARGDAVEFTRLSLAAFERPDPEDIAGAREALAHVPPLPEGEEFTARQLVAMARAHLASLGIEGWSVDSMPNLPTIMKIDSGHRRIELRSDFTFGPVDVVSLLRHEIEAHIVRAENGFRLGHEFLGLGVGYETELDEGIACWLEERHGGIAGRRWEELAARVVAVDAALAEGFRAVHALVRDVTPSLGDDLTFQLVLRVKRGLTDMGVPGGWTKDALYFRGWRRVREWVVQHGEDALHRRLMVARVSWRGLPHAESLARAAAS